MKKGVVAVSPDAYVDALHGWRRELVDRLRDTARSAVRTEEVLKWGHLVYFSDGPAFLIRAEEERVLFGFWRGQRLRELERRLKPGGKYEMATIELREGDTLSKAVVRRLVQGAVQLNASLGDPTKVVRSR